MSTSAPSPSPASPPPAVSAPADATATATGSSSSSSPALSSAERREFDDLRRQNKILKAENAMLQRRLDEERAHRQQWQRDGNHFTAEAKLCCESIEQLDKDARVLALYAELHRLRAKCDVYAEAVEESRNYFFEMKRLYTEVEPSLRSPGAAHKTSSA